MATIYKFLKDQFWLICIPLIMVVAYLNSDGYVAGFVGFFLALVYFVVWVSNNNSIWLHYLYLVRIPFISGFILCVFPFIANWTDASKYLQNLFVMEESNIHFNVVMIFAALTTLIIVAQIKVIIVLKDSSIIGDSKFGNIINILIFAFFFPTFLFLLINNDPNIKWLWGIIVSLIFLFYGRFVMETFINDIKAKGEVLNKFIKIHKKKKVEEIESIELKDFYEFLKTELNERNPREAGSR